MATQSSAAGMTARAVFSSKTAKRFDLLDKYFYFGMSLLIAAVVMYGFSHTVDESLIHAMPPRPWLLWLHGVVFSGWVVFFILQSALVRTHNVKLHRRVGWFGVGLGAVMPVLGIWTAIVMARFRLLHFHAPHIYNFFIVQLWDMVPFAIAFWLAIYWRRKPEFHRRLILVATCTLTGAAFARFPQIPFHWFEFAVDVLILLGVVRDLIVMRRIHVVYRYALPALLAGQIFVVYTWLHASTWWMKIAHAVID